MNKTNETNTSKKNEPNQAELTFTVKRGYSQKDKCYKYGIYKNGTLYEKLTLFGAKNANLVAEYLNMMDGAILDYDNGMAQIFQILRIDKERRQNGKQEQPKRRKAEEQL